MGMIANYQPTTDIELEKIMCLDDVEELQESEDRKSTRLNSSHRL